MNLNISQSKIVLPVLILILICFSVRGQDNTSYDPELAKTFGADEYGMKSYVLVILKKGKRSDFSEEKRKELFAGHQTNMQRWLREGKLIVSGPFYPNEADMEGIFILDIPFEEARDVLDSDPAISAQALSYEAYRWYGSAALPVYLETHKKIQKIKP
ncbi:MAG: hypothetical protein P8X57_04945 [Cyclobacteriaceae bacterium]